MPVILMKVTVTGVLYDHVVRHSSNTHTLLQSNLLKPALLFIIISEVLWEFLLCIFLK